MVICLIKKELYIFNTLGLTQDRLVSSFFWIHVPLSYYISQTKEIFKQANIKKKKKKVYRGRRKWWVIFLLSVTISDARELFVRRCVALPICVFYHLIIEKARTPLL